MDNRIKIKFTKHDIQAAIKKTQIKQTIQGKVIYQSAVFQWVEPPETRNSAGIVGQQSFDDDYLYICVAPNLWARTLLMKGW